MLIQKYSLPSLKSVKKNQSHIRVFLRLYVVCRTNDRISYINRYLSYGKVLLSWKELDKQKERCAVVYLVGFKLSCFIVSLRRCHTMQQIASIGAVV